MVHVMHCEGRGWEFSGNDEFYMHLRGNHAQIRPVGELSVKFHDGDEYVWSTVSLSPGHPSDPYRCVGDVCWTVEVMAYLHWAPGGGLLYQEPWLVESGTHS